MNWPTDFKGDLEFIRQDLDTLRRDLDSLNRLRARIEANVRVLERIYIQGLQKPRNQKPRPRNQEPKVYRPKGVV